MAEDARDTAMWIDIPIPADDTVGSALLTQFLKENRFPFEQSRRFFSVPRSEADRLEQRVDLWAFRADMPADGRLETSLDETLRVLGEIVMLAISAAKANVAPNSMPATGIDLTGL